MPETTTRSSLRRDAAGEAFWTGFLGAFGVFAWPPRIRLLRYGAPQSVQERMASHFGRAGRYIEAAMKESG